MAVLEPEGEHDGGTPSFLRPHEIVHDEVPALRYLVRIRLLEYQDWHTPTSSLNDDEFNGAGEDTDSDDSNHNRRHHRFNRGDGRGSLPRTTRFAGDDEPRLGSGYGPAFQSQAVGLEVLVRSVRCPIPSLSGSLPCHGAGSAFLGTLATRVDEPMEPKADFVHMPHSSPSSVKLPSFDLMEDEAVLCMPQRGVRACDDRVLHSIDACPHRG